MSNPLFVDTGYVIALVNSQDPKYAKILALESLSKMNNHTRGNTV